VTTPSFALALWGLALSGLVFALGMAVHRRRD